MTGAVAKARDWLAELRRARDARDKDAFIDLLTAIALAAPALQGAACEIARGFGDEEDKWEEWAKGFFISPTPPPEIESEVVEVVPQAVPGVLQRFGRKIGAAKPAAASREVADALQAAIAELAKKAPDAEPEEAGEAERRVMLPAVVLPPPPLQPPKPNWDAALEAMNMQHAIIENVGGKTVIASWEPSPIDLDRLMVIFQSKESFLLRYSNRSVSLQVPNGRGGIQTISTPLGHWWLTHRDRLQFRGVTFRPGAAKSERECLNLWQGWGVEAKPGDCRLILQHIKEVVAGGNEEFAEYVVRWIAWSIQNPAAPAEVALVLIGEKGAGKGTLVRCLQRIFGAHAFQVTSREEVIGKFNGHLQDCVLFVADEAYWGGDKRCVGRLQGMITEATLPIERKGIDLIQVPNYLHVLMLAEPGWVIPAGRFERRYAALAVSTARRGDREYFKALHRQINDGGAEALFYDLRGMDLGDWHPREIPETLLRNPALQEQQGHTLPPWEQWYVMLLHNGKLPGALTKKPNTSLTHSLLSHARDKVPRLRWEGEIALRDFVIDQKRLGIACTKARTSSANGWSFPPLAECRAAWERMYGPVKWDHDVEDWGGD
jgi:hypothetical protein